MKMSWMYFLRNSVLLAILTVVLLPSAFSQGNCAAVVQQESYNTTQGTHYFYGWAFHQATVEAAVSMARQAATQRRGGEALKNDPSSSDVVVKSSCGQPHGARAVQTKNDSDDGTYWYTNGLIFGSSEEQAKAEAVTTCIARNARQE